MRVLVVEDEVRRVQFVQQGLDAEGFDVELSFDGLDWQWCAPERPYGTIVLDILLPGMNGQQVCRTLSEEGIWTPILMLTAKTGVYDEAEALDTGADGFLSKPFSFVVLAGRPRALACRGASPRPAKLVAGDLTLDPVHRTCRRGEVSIHLTRREYALLEALVRRAGGGATKTRLLSEVWGDDFDGDDNVVEVNVRYRRHKIDTPFGRQSLQTVCSISGYRLVPVDSGLLCRPRKGMSASGVTPGAQDRASGHRTLSAPGERRHMFRSWARRD